MKTASMDTPQPDADVRETPPGLETRMEMNLGNYCGTLSSRSPSLVMYVFGDYDLLGLRLNQ